MKNMLRMKTYALMILVVLVGCNKRVSLDKPEGQTTSPSTGPDVIAPTLPVPALVFSNITADSVTVTWTAAFDIDAPAANLEYKVVRSRVASRIDTLEKADAYAAGLERDWTAGTTSIDIAELWATETYNIAVLVRDAADNKAFYQLGNFTTLDGGPEVGDFFVKSYCKGTVSLRWGNAYDNISDTENLQYKVVRSSSNNINGVANAEANGSVVMDWTTNTIRTVAKSLPLGSTQYFNVLAKDEAGYISEYGVNSQSVMATQVLYSPIAGEGLFIVPLTGTPTATKILDNTSVSRGVAIDDDCNFYVGTSVRVTKYDGTMDQIEEASMDGWVTSLSLAGNYVVATDSAQSMKTFLTSDLSAAVSTITTTGFVMNTAYRSDASKIYYGTSSDENDIHAVDFNATTGVLSNDVVVNMDTAPAQRAATAIALSSSGKWLTGFSLNTAIPTYTVGIYNPTAPTNLVQMASSSVGNRANGIAEDADGNIYTYDFDTGAIIKFDSNLNVIANPYITLLTWGWSFQIK